LDIVGTANPSTTIASLLAHEIGHCIGFRHTDYATRVSCGRPQSPENSPYGTIHIPGTPVGHDPTSWMMACPVPQGGNRSFNANDIKALRYLY
jgi:hypothetical protein